MRGMFFRGVLLGSLTAVLVLSASAALAGTGVGGIFNLGRSNTVNQTSSLSGSSSGAQLSVSNSSTGSADYGIRVNGVSAAPALVAHNSAGPAALFFSPTTVAPFAVNSTQKVANLNADRLDGLHSSAFVPAPVGDAYSVYKDSSPTGDVTFTLQNLPAGSYVINAKVLAVGVVGGSKVLARCALAAGGDVDWGETTISTLADPDELNSNTQFGPNYAMIPTQLVHTFSTTGNVTMQCQGTFSFFGSPVSVVQYQFAKITAVRVHNLLNTSG